MRERVRNCSVFSLPTLLGYKVSGFVLVVVRVLQWFVSVWTPLLGRKLCSCWWFLLHRSRMSMWGHFCMFANRLLPLCFFFISHNSSLVCSPTSHPNFVPFTCWMLLLCSLLHINPFLSSSRSTFLSSDHWWVVYSCGVSSTRPLPRLLFSHACTPLCSILFLHFSTLCYCTRPVFPCIIMLSINISFCME